MLMTVFLVPASPFVLRSTSLRRRLIVNASQDNVGAMHSRVEESYGAQKLVKAACSSDSDGRHFAPVKAALARLARGKTTVTTIADTDWIVVLDNGVGNISGATRPPLRTFSPALQITDSREDTPLMADCFFFYRIPEGHALLCLLPAGVLTQVRRGCSCR